MIVDRTPTNIILKKSCKASSKIVMATNDEHDTTADATLTFSILSRLIVRATSTRDAALPPFLLRLTCTGRERKYTSPDAERPPSRLLAHTGARCGVGWYVWRPGGGVGGEEQVA